MAVIRSDPPEVFLAEDEHVLGRVLATQVIARADPRQLGISVGAIRSALLREEWGEAVLLWMEATGNVVDAYPDDEIWTRARLDEERTAFELRLAPIFEDPPPA